MVKGGGPFFSVGQRGDQIFFRVKEGGPNFFLKRGPESFVDSAQFLIRIFIAPYFLHLWRNFFLQHSSHHKYVTVEPIQSS